MKIAFCLIVFNGGPYVRKWLDHYLGCPWADYVCVAEGATRNMADVLNLPNAHSTDGTIEALYDHRDNPKLRFVTSATAYPEKMEQQNACISLVPDDADYIWIADADEFYHYGDILLMSKILKREDYTFAEFRPYHFWKNVNTCAIGGIGWGYDQPFDRLFKFHPGARFTNHRPITMADKQGRPLKQVKPLAGNNNPVRLYHYSYITQKMVYEKMLYYTRTFNRDYINNWYKPVWEAWTPGNRDVIEANYSIHPTVRGGKTVDVDLVHPILVDDLGSEK